MKERKIPVGTLVILDKSDHLSGKSAAFRQEIVDQCLSKGMDQKSVTVVDNRVTPRTKTLMNPVEAAKAAAEASNVVKYRFPRLANNPLN